MPTDEEVAAAVDAVKHSLDGVLHMFVAHVAQSGRSLGCIPAVATRPKFGPRRSVAFQFVDEDGALYHVTIEQKASAL